MMVRDLILLQTAFGAAGTNEMFVSSIPLLPQTIKPLELATGNMKLKRDVLIQSTRVVEVEQGSVHPFSLVLSAT